LLYIYISFIFGIHVYAATIHNTTEETSREEYVSTIEHERIMSESHSFAHMYIELFLFQINPLSNQSLASCIRSLDT